MAAAAVSVAAAPRHLVCILCFFIRKPKCGCIGHSFDCSSLVWRVHDPLFP